MGGLGRRLLTSSFMIILLEKGERGLTNLVRSDFVKSEGGGGGGGDLLTSEGDLLTFSINISINKSLIDMTITVSIKLKNLPKTYLNYTKIWYNLITKSTLYNNIK